MNTTTIQPHLLLAATDMHLQHPRSGQVMHLQARLADDIAEVVERLGWREALAGVRFIDMVGAAVQE